METCLDDLSCRVRNAPSFRRVRSRGVRDKEKLQERVAKLSAESRFLAPSPSIVMLSEGKVRKVVCSRRLRRTACRKPTSSSTDAEWRAVSSDACIGSCGHL